MTTSALILIVDDNPTNQLLAAHVLKHAGFSVLAAESAAQTLEVLKTVKPDLILMDIQMPEMDGLTLTRLLKSDPAYQNIPIVALTACAMKGDEEKAYAAGCDGYIAKPIDSRKLAQQIAELLPHHTPKPTQLPTP